MQMSELNVSERQVVRKAIDRPESVLLVRLKHVSEISDSNTTTERELAVANVHVTWTQLKYPALQALQVTFTIPMCHIILYRDVISLPITNHSLESNYKLVI